MDDAVAGLADAIDALRLELYEAYARGDGQGIGFRVNPIELTLQVVVTKIGGGKIGWGVLQAGARLESATTQTLKLQLQPIQQNFREDPVDLIVADQAQNEPQLDSATQAQDRD
ncbi:trypco2 family protein [Actinocrispum wychmicini]|uniref:trypco2 family protein n=1 Tax=Actinocrispum wychmicini TaxID=1213861 RepID=UPI0010514209|nr:trypco2 family protein [Actinocrispum wychmicini]